MVLKGNYKETMHFGVPWGFTILRHTHFGHPQCDNVAVSKAAFPRLPIALVDNRCHLQARAPGNL